MALTIEDIKEMAYTCPANDCVRCQVKFTDNDGYVWMSIKLGQDGQSVSAQVAQAVSSGTYGVPTPYSETTYELERAKGIRLDDINTSFTKQIMGLLDNSPQIETAAWGKQEKEAKAYKSAKENSDPLPDTPIVDFILLGRNGSTGTETKDELIDKINNKVSNFEQLGYLIGKRHRAEKLVLAGNVISEVEAIVWSELE